MVQKKWVVLLEKVNQINHTVHLGGGGEALHFFPSSTTPSSLLGHNRHRIHLSPKVEASGSYGSTKPSKLAFTIGNTELNIEKSTQICSR